MKHHRPRLTRSDMVKATAPFYAGPRRDLWEMSLVRLQSFYKQAQLKALIKLNSGNHKLNKKD